MAKFHFCITTGAPGYLPDAQDYVAAECAVDAFDAIKEAISVFRDGLEDEVEVERWEPFFERGCRAPDASMWHFTLATNNNDGAVLDLVGMTEDEYHRQA